MCLLDLSLTHERGASTLPRVVSVSCITSSKIHDHNQRSLIIWIDLNVARQLPTRSVMINFKKCDKSFFEDELFIIMQYYYVFYNNSSIKPIKPMNVGRLYNYEPFILLLSPLVIYY